MTYDPDAHSKARLGMAGMVPVVPVMPSAAQVSRETGMLHLRLLGDSYIRAGLPSLAPASYKSIVDAIQAQPLEPSWSGTGSQYYVLEVEPDPSGLRAVLKAGPVVVGSVAVFNDADIVSADVALSEQYAEGAKHAEEPPGPGKPKGPGQGPQGPGVN
jgi:hypothetical protein